MHSRKMRILSLAVPILAAGFFTGCEEKIEPGIHEAAPGRTVKARVATAQISREPFIYEAVGTISARISSTLSSKLLGVVREVRVNEGDRVKKGDPLVVIDKRQVAAQLNRAKAALAEARQSETSARSARDAAKAAARLARSTYERYRVLRRDKLISQQEFDEVEARYRQAAAALAEAEARLEAAGSRVAEARAALSDAAVSRKDAVVRAPYDGKITAKMVDVGDLASPGTPFLVIERKGVYCTDLELPERHIRAVKVGDLVDVVIPALNYLKVKGTIGRIIPSADPRSRSFQVKVAMPEGLDLRSGMFARVQIPVGGKGLLLVPRKAVVARGQLSGVYLLDEENRARFRLVRVGKDYGDRVEILSGLAAGRRYMAEVPVGMEDGVKVVEVKE